jgi:hypothetical protein
MGGPADEVAGYERIVRELEADPDPAARARVPWALVARARADCRLGRYDEAIATYRDLAERSGDVLEPALRAVSSGG